jgi:hypothetical protein
MMNPPQSIGALSNIPKDVPSPEAIPTEGVQQASASYISLPEFISGVLPEDFPLDPENLEKAIRTLVPDKGQQGILMFELDEMTKNITEGM